MRSLAPTALVAASLIAGCASDAQHLAYVDQQATRMASRPAGVLAAACIRRVPPGDSSDPRLHEAAEKAAMVFGNALTARLTERGFRVTRTITREVCHQPEMLTGPDLQDFYARRDAPTRLVAALVPATQTMRPGRMKLELPEADASALAAEFEATDLWVVAAHGQLVHWGAFAKGVTAVMGVLVDPLLLIGPDDPRQRSGLWYSVFLADLERREAAWAKKWQLLEAVDPAAPEVPDADLLKLLDPFASGRAPEPAPQVDQQ